MDTFKQRLYREYGFFNTLVAEPVIIRVHIVAADGLINFSVRDSLCTEVKTGSNLNGRAQLYTRHTDNGKRGNIDPNQSRGISPRSGWIGEVTGALAVPDIRRITLIP